MRLTRLPKIHDKQRFGTFYATDQPVVVANAAREIPAYARWTDEYLLALHGDAAVTVTMADQRTTARMRFSDYWNYWLHPEKFQSNHGYVYLSDYFIHPAPGHPVLGALSEHVSFPLDRGADPVAEWTSIYAGPPGSATPLHKDAFATRTWLALFRGRKHWRICAPAAIAPAQVAELDLFGAEPIDLEIYEVEMDAGDIIYLPPNWWHQVRNLTSSLAISSNFCGFDKAKANLRYTLDNPSLEHRDLWIKTWTAVVASEGAAR